MPHTSKLHTQFQTCFRRFHLFSPTYPLLPVMVNMINWRLHISWVLLCVYEPQLKWHPWPPWSYTEACSGFLFSFLVTIRSYNRHRDTRIIASRVGSINCETHSSLIFDIRLLFFNWSFSFHYENLLQMKPLRLSACWSNESWIELSGKACFSPSYLHFVICL